MGRDLKSLLVILLVIGMLFSFAGCRGNEGQSIETPDLQIDRYTGEIPVYITMPDSSRPSEEELSEWVSYIENKYSLLINLIPFDFILPIDEAMSEIQSNLGIDIGYLEGLDSPKGLVKFMGPEDLTELVNSGLIMPLNEIYKDVPAVAVMNDTALMSLSDSDGNLWAFPASANHGSFHRIYDKSFLEGAGAGLPQDTDSFYKYARYIATGDPDGNGRNDTYIGSISYNNIPGSFEDIFHAFGCYTVYGMPVAHNPVSGEIENVVDNDNFASLMSFIKLLVDENLVCNETYYQYGITPEGTELKYRLASVITSNEIPGYFDGWEFGEVLVGYNDSKLIQLHSSGTGYAVLKDTENAAAMMDSIIKASDSLEGYCDFNFGREGYNYEISGQTIRVILTSDPNSGVHSYPIRFGAGYYDYQSAGYHVDYSYGYGDNETTYRDNSEFLARRKEFIDQYIGTDLVYTVPMGTYDNEILALNVALMDDFNSMMSDILKGRATYEEAVDKFMTECRKQNADGIISNANERLDASD